MQNLIYGSRVEVEKCRFLPLWKGQPFCRRKSVGVTHKKKGEGRGYEARRYIAAGGSIVEYGKRLTERQNTEIAIYNRVKADLDNASSSMPDDAFMSYWEKRNDELRNLGIKTVGLGED